MKKSIVVLMVTIMFALCSMECVAESSVEIEKSADNVESVLGTYVGCGYTETGIYYEVYGENISYYASETVTVTRTVVYEGIVQPSSTLYWEEEIDGEWYAGTLSRVKYNISNNKTTAVYTGTLYLQ